MKIGAAYIRVSTDDQLEFSPDSQLHKITAYAKSNNIILPPEFIFMEEEGRSGRNTKHRPEFQRMIGLAKSDPKPFEVILVWKYSRFARNREDSVVYKSMLRKQRGIDVVSVSESVGDDKMSILIEAIIEAMDEWYSINLSEEVLRGMAEKASRGGIVGSPAYGYKAEGNVFVPIPEEAKIVQMVFESFVHNDMGCRDIAAMLNAMGVRTKKGRLMENRTVEYMLHNPVYIGKIRWSPNGQIERDWEKPDLIISDGAHEPIISAELFEQAARKLEDRKKMYAKYARQSSENVDYILKGLVRCSSCGSTLTRSASGLQCHSYAKGVCKQSHYITLKNITDRVLNMIETTFTDENFEVSVKNVGRLTDQNEIIESQIEKEYVKLERIKAAYADGIDTLEEYKANKAKIQASIDFLIQKKASQPEPKRDCKKEFLDKNRKAVKTLRDPEITEAEKNCLLRTFVDHIIFNRAKNQIQIFYYI